MEGFVMGFSAGVSVGAGVVMVGDMGRLRFLDCFAGWLPECSDGGGTSLGTVASTVIVSESEDRLELLPKDLRDLEVEEAAKGAVVGPNGPRLGRPCLLRMHKPRAATLWWVIVLLSSPTMSMPNP